MLKNGGDAMERLKGKNLLLVGLTLFSMFFGAGNLIFPSFLGAQAGTATWSAMLGLVLSAIGLPVLGVVAVARSGGLPNLAGRVHPVFGTAFTVLIYLSIGPCLAIPRTASTSFEMAVPPFVPEGTPLLALRVIYSAVFFGLSLLLALRPEKLTDRLGKILCPLLIALIAVVFVGTLMNPSPYGPATGAYATQAVAHGFLAGYQTMDAIAALNFGMIVALNIRARGVTDDRAVTSGTIKAGWIAGAVLLVVYAMLAHVGAVSGGRFPAQSNGAGTLTVLVGGLFGTLGSAVLAAIFVIACFNTCTGLISCCGDYFHSLIPRFSYRAWAAFFAAVSLLISVAGLDLILQFSGPLLNAIYPPSIVLIVLGLCQRWLEGRRAVYPWAVGTTTVVSVLWVLGGFLPPLGDLLTAVLPFASLDLGWVVPALLGAGVGLLASRKKTA